MKINERISYIEATDNPLSADIGVIDGRWLFDVGNNKEEIKKLTENYNIVISHFHIDHSGSLNLINEDNLYVSKESYRHTGKGIIVDKDIYVDDFHIFPMPSIHCKGCLGLEIDDYAFVGDALYSKSKDGYRIYNVQLLKSLIDLLKELKAKHLLVSHYKGLIRNKSEVISELEEIYKLKEKNVPEIKIPY